MWIQWEFQKSMKNWSGQMQTANQINAIHLSLETVKWDTKGGLGIESKKQKGGK